MDPVAHFNRIALGLLTALEGTESGYVAFYGEQEARARRAVERSSGAPERAAVAERLERDCRQKLDLHRALLQKLETQHRRLKGAVEGLLSTFLASTPISRFADALGERRGLEQDILSLMVATNGAADADLLKRDDIPTEYDQMTQVATLVQGLQVKEVITAPERVLPILGFFLELVLDGPEDPPLREGFLSTYEELPERETGPAAASKSSIVTSIVMMTSMAVVHLAIQADPTLRPLLNVMVRSARASMQRPGSDSGGSDSDGEGSVEYVSDGDPEPLD